MRQAYPILEFDPQRKAILEPENIHKPLEGFKHCVLCFFQDVLDDLKGRGLLRQVYALSSEIGPNPLYEMAHNGQELSVIHAGVGASLSATFMEELIALGCCKFIACGGCGVLDSRVGLGQVIVPTAAIRDEGTSYHYLPPAREVAVSQEAVEAICATMDGQQVDYVLGKTWTTDAPYRETPDKIALRQAEGCLTVEMETAAFCVVAEFRGVQFGQILYGGDDVTGETWDHRDWHKLTATREKLFFLAVEACLLL